MLAQSVVDPLRFQAHVDVWLLVAALTASYVYMVRFVGPHAVAAGQPVVTRRNVWCFVAAMLMLWTASDWPTHDIGEQYLYSIHMLQHMMLTYFLPPLVLLATPEWVLRVLVGEGRAYTVLRWFCKPVVAGLLSPLLSAHGTWLAYGAAGFALLAWLCWRWELRVHPQFAMHAA